VEWIFKRYLVAAGLAKERLAFHGLRHSAGQHLTDQGYPLQEIQDVLRHKNPATARIYTEASRTRLEDVYKRGVRFPS
jgi:site-specific recombinase XerD